MKITKSLNQSGYKVSKKRMPYDNACIESFHPIIKKEEIYTKTFRTFDEANVAIFRHIEGWYNRGRMHFCY